eukprot:1176844-Prorocentrum_minimum.AAC.1
MKLNRPFNGMKLNCPFNGMKLNRPFNRMKLNRPFNRTKLNHPFNGMKLNRPFNRMKLNRPFNGMKLNCPFNGMKLNRPFNRYCQPRSKLESGVTRLCNSTPTHHLCRRTLGTSHSSTITGILSSLEFCSLALVEKDGIRSRKFGTKKYWTENGEDVSIVNTVFAIDNCLREPMSVGQCRDIRGVLE